MRKWLRRLRGAIGMGLTWAAAWFSAGIAVLLVVGLDAADVPFPLFFALLGFLAGVTFSVILGVVERRRRFGQMSLPRFALWGGVGGLLLSGVLALTAGLAGELLVLAPIFAMSGAGCAAGSLALARKAEGRGSLHVHTGTAQSGHIEPEVQDLLGEGMIPQRRSTPSL